MNSVLMIASEAAPFAKTGGLADVIGALPKALKARGADVAVALPRYRCVSLHGARRVYNNLPVWLGASSWSVTVWSAQAGVVPFFLVDCPELFDRDTLYGPSGTDYPDNHIRFAVFCKAALGIVRNLFRPDVLHCHDWQSALAAAYLKTLYAGDPTFFGIPTLFTIHNLGYPGLFPKEALAEIGLDDRMFRPDGMEFYGQVSLLKGGLVYSDALSTVSRGYAREIQTEEYGFGLDGILRSRSPMLSGIVNGVDYSEWSPATDPFIAANYGPQNLEAKRVCKRDLVGEFGLPPEAADRPLIGIVSRFTPQKGFDLIEEVGGELMEQDIGLVALGTGDPVYENFFVELARRWPEKAAVRVAYDNRLAHKIEAGADIFLMPSRYEPCGLNQIYSLKYGTVPVVRATGGLDDTIDEATGFKFREYTGAALLDAVGAALAAYANPERWRALMLAGMGRDFSWDASAGEYLELYDRLAGRAGVNPAAPDPHPKGWRT